MTNGELVELYRSGWPTDLLQELADRELTWRSGDLARFGELLIHRTLTVPPAIGRSPRVFYTDGSGVSTDEAVGCAAVTQDEGAPAPTSPDREIGRPAVFSGGGWWGASLRIGPGTNNIAELTGIWLAVANAPQTTTSLLIRSDSEYAIGSLTQPWRAKKNAELIGTIRAHLHARGNVCFEHVRGHSGNPGNELADRLAGAARLRSANRNLQTANVERS